MRIPTLALALAFGAGLAHAQVVSPLGGSTSNPQTTPPATATPAPAAAPTDAPATAPAHRAASRSHRSFADRFQAANTTHDGKLTRAQARSGRLRSVVRDFDKIDSGKQGYVTLDQVRAFQSEQRAARRAARAAKPAKIE